MGRRLKLAVLSPRLLDAYQASEMTLEQLTALALIDDHVQLEMTFFEAPTWQRDATTLRRLIAVEAIHAGRDKLVRFVGLDAYRAAGGTVRLDLFTKAGNHDTSRSRYCSLDWPSKRRRPLQVTRS